MKIDIEGGERRRERGERGEERGGEKEERTQVVNR